MSQILSKEELLVQGLLYIIKADSSVIEGGHNMPVIWTGECAYKAEELLKLFGCEMTREEKLTFLRNN